VFGLLEQGIQSPILNVMAVGPGTVIAACGPEIVLQIPKANPRGKPLQYPRHMSKRVGVEQRDQRHV
jgi:hypothetical protein